MVVGVSIEVEWRRSLSGSRTAHAFVDGVSVCKSGAKIGEHKVELGAVYGKVCQYCSMRHAPTTFRPSVVERFPDRAAREKTNVDGRAFAEAVGVNYGTVKRWLVEGLPCERSGRGKLNIDIDVARTWALEKYGTYAFKGETFVYVAERPSDGAVKIGWTRDVERRLQEIRKELRQSVRLVAALPGDKPTELRLHKAFADVRVDGEWFLASTNDVVSALRRGA